MQARVDTEVWTFLGEAIRFTGAFRDNGKIFTGLWEFRSDEANAWQPLMDVTFKLRAGESNGR